MHNEHAIQNDLELYMNALNAKWKEFEWANML